MRRGVSPVITIVLLVMITISMTGFAFIWFTRMGTGLQDRTEAGAEKTSENIMKIAIIDNVVGGANSVITIRNIGSVAIAPGDIAVYVAGQPAVCSGLKAINPQEIGLCIISEIDCTGSKVKVSAAGGSDEKTC
jgi:flagellin-like protein